MTNSPILLYVHIPKAGGTTFSELIYNNCHLDPYYKGADGYLHAGVYYVPLDFFRDSTEPFPESLVETLRRDDLAAVVGHVRYGIHELLSRPYCYVTMLRDPVERAISLYYYHLKYYHHYLPQQTEVVSFEEFISRPPYREVDNGQTRRISGENPHIGECTAAMLESAKSHLSEHFTMVGVTERFEESAVLLKEKMGWKPKNDYYYYPRNRNPSRPSALTLPQETKELILRRHQFDVELYSFACELLDAATTQFDLTLTAEVESLKNQTQRWLAAEGELPRD